MKRNLIPQLCVVAVLAAILVFLTETRARESSVWGQLGLLVEIRHQLVNEYVEEPDTKEMIEAAVQGMVNSLGDPYTVYMPMDEVPNFEKEVTGRFSGIGAMIEPFDNRLRIVTPLEDSPAWEAGVMAGDVVLEINGETTLDMTPDQAVKLLTGEEGTDVTIHVRHETGEEQTITITRQIIEVQTIRGFMRDAEQNYDYMLDDANRIGYIRLTQFTDTTAEDLREVLEGLLDQGVRGIILDVRFDPGGLLDSAQEIGDMFLPAGDTIVSIRGRATAEKVHKSENDPLVPIDIPLVVIANGASASAAEILTGALADNDRALFVGSRTFGKGSVQTVKMLDDGQGALKITNAYWYTPKDRMIHRREKAEEWGVDPSEDAYVPMKPTEVEEMLKVRREADLVKNGNGGTQTAITPEWLDETMKDPQLSAALRAVLGKIETGDWPAVGESNVEELVKAERRNNLERRLELLNEGLAAVEEELAALDNPDATVETEDGVEEGVIDEEALSPTDPMAVEDQVSEEVVEEARELEAAPAE